MSLMNVINSAVSRHREKAEEKRRREEEERRWVDEQPETEMICSYMASYMDRMQPGYMMLKQLRKSVELSVLGDRIRLSWDDPQSLNRPVESFRDVAMAGKLAANRGTQDITFRDIYSWYGDTDPDYYRTLGTDAMRWELSARICDRLSALNHLKVNCGRITVRPFH